MSAVMIVEAKVVFCLPSCPPICIPWLHSNKSKIHLQDWTEYQLNSRMTFALMAAS